MKKTIMLGIFLMSVSIVLFAQSTGSENQARLLINPENTKWDPAPKGSESVTLREDSKTGATELLARYPAGHVFPPHWHDANERIVLIEGRLAIEGDGEKKMLEPGGYAYLPAHQIQRMSCVADTRCSFYVSWDGSPKLYPVGK
jgi:quercetin dioxygenase-like cupin family protein